MSHKRMVETEALLQQRIAELLAQAGTVDTAEQSESELPKTPHGPVASPGVPV